MNIDNLKQTVGYLIGYTEKNEFWCEGETSNYEEANKILEEKIASNKSKNWEIYEKLVIYRKAYKSNFLSRS